MRFRRVVARYPQSGYCDNALLAIGDLYREMGRRFDARLRRGRGAGLSPPGRGVPEQQPGREGAVQRGRDRARGWRPQGDRGRGPRVPGRVPGFAAGGGGQGGGEEGRAGAGGGPAHSPAARAAQVFNLRFWSGASSTRVVLDIEKAVRYKYDRISNPDRLWVDLEGTRLHPNLMGKMFPVGDGLLEKIRIGQNKDTTVRVVLDFKDVKDHTIFYLENPTRLVVDVRARPRRPRP